jgi:hypothetical protein
MAVNSSNGRKMWSDGSTPIQRPPSLPLSPSLSLSLPLSPSLYLYPCIPSCPTVHCSCSPSLVPAEPSNHRYLPQPPACICSAMPNPTDADSDGDEAHNFGVSLSPPGQIDRLPQRKIERLAIFGFASTLLCTWESILTYEYSLKSSSSLNSILTSRL